jgi:hypothetical protein
MTVLEWLSTPQVPATQERAEFDSGIVLFCAIGLLLSIASMLFGWYDMPAAVGF